MLPFNPIKHNCTGCSACYSICPVHCISMKADKEGFLYPEASDACISCGLCEKVCPAFKTKQDNHYQQKAIAAVTRDKNIWRRSSSGGAFSEICRHWADDNTLIVGAAWDELRVHHIGVKGFSGIGPLCKSKYLSSAIENTFLDIRRSLINGRKAIFCGCPCQVAGLKSFLHKDYDNLLTIDFICHGQGSPYVFETCVQHLSETLGEKVVHYEFRSKRTRYEMDYLSQITTNDSTHYITKDRYVQLFLSQNALRPSCGENCKYRDIHRTGDITIADFKGMSKIFPDLSFPKKNWSTVVCNTIKGEECFSNLSKTMEVRTITIENIVEFNPLFAKQTWFSKDRDAFFADFTNKPKQAIIYWTKPASLYSPSLKKIIFLYLPSWLKRFIYSFTSHFHVQHE